MPVVEIYSRRKKLAEHGESDIYQYDDVPEQLPTQVWFILEDSIGPYRESQGGYGTIPKNNNKAWTWIRNQLCREKGVQSLANESQPKTDLHQYLYSTANSAEIDGFLDVIELSFRYIEKMIAPLDRFQRDDLGIRLHSEKAISELNERFRLAAFGYRYEESMVVRVDSEFIHSEVVKPALHFLSDKRFAGPRQEFLNAHAHYRAGESRDAITDANNAFESTMKAICDLKGWTYNAGARASDLLKVIRKNGLLPQYLDKSFDQLAATLASGLPKVRDEEGSHGQGAEETATPDFIAAYALHLAAAKILLLAEAFNESEK